LAVYFVRTQRFVALRKRRDAATIDPNVVRNFSPGDNRQEKALELVVERFDDLVSRAPMRRSPAA
jgi:hypothetical protein